MSCLRQVDLRFFLTYWCSDVQCFWVLHFKAMHTFDIIIFFITNRFWCVLRGLLRVGSNFGRFFQHTAFHAWLFSTCFHPCFIFFRWHWTDFLTSFRHFPQLLLLCPLSSAEGRINSREVFSTHPFAWLLSAYFHSIFFFFSLTFDWFPQPLKLRYASVPKDHEKLIETFSAHERLTVHSL